MGGQQSLGQGSEDLTTSFCYYDGNTAPKIEQVPGVTEPRKDSPSPPTLRATFGKRFRRRVPPGNRLSMLREEDSFR